MYLNLQWSWLSVSSRNNQRKCTDSVLWCFCLNCSHCSLMKGNGRSSWLTGNHFMMTNSSHFPFVQNFSDTTAHIQNVLRFPALYACIVFSLCVCVCVWLQLIDTFSTEISELKQEMVQPAREPETEILHRWVLPSSPSSSSSLELMGYITFTFSHLPHTFIQSDLQMRTILHGVVCVLKD